MKFYCGIDLSARDCQVCVIDEQLKLVVQQKLMYTKDEPISMRFAERMET